VIIGGAVFGYMAGIAYWFPKVFGFRLHEGWGKASFWFWIVGFYLAFMPLYILGFMGMTRRLNTTTNPEWEPYLYVAVVGAVLIGLGILCTLIQIAVSIIKRKELADHTGDPWNARTLEWSTSSPPPFYNFAWPASPALSCAATTKTPTTTCSRRRLRGSRRHARPDLIADHRNPPARWARGCFCLCVGNLLDRNVNKYLMR